MFGRGSESHDWLLGASGAEMLSSDDGSVWFSISWEARAEEEVVLEACDVPCLWGMHFGFSEYSEISMGLACH